MAYSLYGDSDSPWYASSPSVYSQPYNFMPSGGGGGGVNWGSLFTNPLAWLAGAGTGFGIYSNWNNGRNVDRAYQRNNDVMNRILANNMAQQAMYNRQIGNYFDEQNAFRGDMLGRIDSLMAQAMAAQNQAPINSYAPMSDAASKAMRRGITAQQALRTGGNEGTLVDALVGEGMAKTETDRYDAAARLDSVLNQQRVNLWPSMLQAAVSGLGALGPAAPIAPMSMGYPPMQGYPAGPPASTDSLGQFLKWWQGQQALDAERASNNAYRSQVGNWSRGPSNVPDTVYGSSDYSPDYPTGYGGWT